MCYPCGNGPRTPTATNGALFLAHHRPLAVERRGLRDVTQGHALGSLRVIAGTPTSPGGRRPAGIHRFAHGTMIPSRGITDQLSRRAPRKASMKMRIKPASSIMAHTIAVVRAPLRSFITSAGAPSERASFIRLLPQIQAGTDRNGPRIRRLTNP